MNEHKAKLEQAIDNMEKTSVCLDIFDRALADERRRVWEEAAEIAMILKASRRPSLDWGAGYIEACKDMLTAIAKAHAGQEG